MVLGAKHLGYWGAKRLGWKIEAKRLGGIRLGGKRLGGETSCDQLIDPVGKLLFREKKSKLVTGTATFPPLCSFGRGYNSVNIAVV